MQKEDGSNARADEGREAASTFGHLAKAGSHHGWLAARIGQAAGSGAPHMLRQPRECSAERRAQLTGGSKCGGFVTLGRLQGRSLRLKLKACRRAKVGCAAGRVRRTVKGAGGAREAARGRALQLWVAGATRPSRPPRLTPAAAAAAVVPAVRAAPAWQDR